MADNIAPFAFTTQEDWYGELTFRSAEDGSALSLAGRQFVMLVTPARSGAQIVEPSVELKMDAEGGLALKEGDPSTLVFRVPREKTKSLERIEYTADILEVVGAARYLFMPVRISYAEPSALRAFLSRFLGAKVSFASRVQPIVTPVAVAGRQGARGSGYLTGQAAPTAADGQDGDYWIDASVAPRMIYGPKTGGVWPADGEPFATDLTPEVEAARDEALSARDVAAIARTEALTAADRAESAATQAVAKAGQFDTLAALRAIPAPTIITAGEVVNEPANNGGYQYNPANAAAGWVLKTKTTLPALDAREARSEVRLRRAATAVVRPAQQIDGAIEQPTRRIDGSRDASGGLGTTTAPWTAWVFVAAPADMALADTLTIAISNTQQVKRLSTQVFERFTGAASGGPSTSKGDVLLATLTTDVSGLQQVNGDTFVLADIALGSIPLRPDCTYLHIVTGLPATGDTQLSFGTRLSGSPAASPELNGYFMRSDQAASGFQAASTRLFFNLWGRGGGDALAAVRRPVQQLAPVLDAAALAEVAVSDGETGLPAQPNTGASYNGWYVAKRVSEAAFLTSFDTLIRNSTGNGVFFRYSVYRRDDDAPAALAANTPFQDGLRIARDTVRLDSFTARKNTADPVAVRVPLDIYAPAGTRLMITMEVLNASGAPVAFEATLISWQAGEEEGLRGGRRASAGSDFAWEALVSNFRVWGRLNTRRVEAPAQNAASLPRLFFPRERIAHAALPTLSNTQWRAASGFNYFAAGLSPSRPIKPAAALIWVMDANGIASLRYRVWRRPAAVGDTGTLFPGGHARDTLLLTRTAAIGTLVADATSAAQQQARLDLSSLPALVPGDFYFVDWEGLDASGAITPLGTLVGQTVTLAAPNVLRGFFGTGANARSNLTSRQTVPLTIIEASNEIAVPADPIEQTPISSAETTVVAGRSVTLPGFEIAQPSGSLQFPPTTVTITDIPAETITGEEVTLINGSARFLSRQFVSVSAVRRKTDGAVFVAGTDYTLDAEPGRITALNAGAAAPVLVDYTGYKTRYDLVHADPLFGGVAVAEGTARGVNPDEYRPSTPAGRIPVFSLYVYPGNVEVIPLLRFNRRVRRGSEARHQEWLNYCRRALPKSRCKLVRGQALRWAGYGDSTTEQGGNGARNPTEPNKYRDVLANYYVRIPADTQATYPRFDGDEGPGAHIHLGWNWIAKAILDAAYGVSIIPDNWGIGGTTDGTGGDAGVGTINALNPTRLNALIASAPDVVVWCFGLNNLGGTATRANAEAFIDAMLAAGIEPIMLTPPMISRYHSTKTQRDWLFTHDSIVQAARFKGVAYVSTWDLFAPGREGATGLSQRSLANANTINHAGAPELRIIGERIAELFL